MEKKWKEFADDVFAKTTKKFHLTVERNLENIPYTSVQGQYDDQRGNICKWTNGFWPGMLWLMYMDTGEDIYREIAGRAESTLDCAFREYEKLQHDVGFMWHLSSGFDYRLTGNQKSRTRSIIAAHTLMGRYNIEGGYIRAWNDRGNEKNAGWAIIDCMMNLALLYWASEETGDPRFSYVAKHHADKTLEHHLRQDGSVKHIVVFDKATGEELDELGGQGYAAGSSWSRGQAWGLYGFVISYEHTGDIRYLNAAKRIANYVISCACQHDWMTLCDFRSPDMPQIYDSTAGAIAASGMIELSRNVPEQERSMYENAGGNMLQVMERKFCNWNEEEDGILMMGTERYHGESGRHIPIIYGDYFFMEAISKLRGNLFQIW